MFEICYVLFYEGTELVWLILADSGAIPIQNFQDLQEENVKWVENWAPCFMNY